MKILKFKKVSKNKYKLFLDNDESITLYEEIIIKNNLLISKTLDKDVLDDLINQNNEFYAYDLAINYISIRVRSIKELRDYLLKKGISINEVEKTIKRLIKENYLNDRKFTELFVNDQFKLTNKGPLKIKKELLAHGIDLDVINEQIERIDKLSVEKKISKLLERYIKTKRESSGNLKLKVVTYFCNLGYEKDMILDKLSNYEIKSDEIKLKRDYERLYNKYKDKYQGNNLFYFISQKLYSKGYTSSDIANVIRINNN